jgi:Tfp pilus assembly PilM family ATPase
MSRARGISSWWTSPPPVVGVEFTSRHVAAVAVTSAAPAVPVVQRQATVPLPLGALTPALNASNIADRAAVAAAVAQALDAVGHPRRIAVVLADVVCRVSIVKLDTVPARVDERDQMLRWHVRKAAPFPIEAAQVSIREGRRLEDGGQEFLVALARRDIVEEYEQACASASAHAGIVDLATSGVLSVATAGAGSDDWMLVHLGADSASIVIVREGMPIFFRNRAADAEGPLADAVHQAAMYYQDRLGGAGFARVLLTGVAASDGEVRAIEESLAGRAAGIERLDLARVVRFPDRIGVPPDLAAVLAPAVGVVLGDGSWRD